MTSETAIETPPTTLPAADISPVAAPPPVGTTGHEAGSLDRMARLRSLVRKDGLSAEDAARQVGVDPIIAQLWLRLPDDLWPGARPTGIALGATGAPPLAQPPAPASGLRRVITCRVPAPAYDRLRAAESPLLDVAAAALETGLTLPRPEPAPGGGRFPRRPIAVPVTSVAFSAIAELAQTSFGGDMRDAAGWLIARGLGMAIPLPTPGEINGTERSTVTTARQPVAAQPAARFVVPPRRRPEQRAPLPPDESAPGGDELRARREAVGISQRDLAAASGLSRGLVAEIERGRRRHVLTRLRLSETLASLERSK